MKIKVFKDYSRIDWVDVTRGSGKFVCRQTKFKDLKPRLCFESSKRKFNNDGLRSHVLVYLIMEVELFKVRFFFFFCKKGVVNRLALSRFVCQGNNSFRLLWSVLSIVSLMKIVNLVLLYYFCSDSHPLISWGKDVFLFFPLVVRIN